MAAKFKPKGGAAMKLMTVFIAALLCLTCAAQAEQETTIQSGLEIGHRTPSFPVFAVTGPNKGKTLCYI